VAVQLPEGFRLDPNARWDDEIKRLGEAFDTFERVANVVQSTLLKLCSPLESLSRLPRPSLIRVPGRRQWPRFSLLSLEQWPGISPPGTSGCPARIPQSDVVGKVHTADPHRVGASSEWS
jgi:hypothetical protein